MAEHVKAWQCIGCGRIEAPQTCIGVCDYKRIEMVYAGDHAEEIEALRAKAAQYEALVRQLARITPREGTYERTYRALQEQARKLVAEGAPAPE